jgi:hypothetical protein
MKTMIKNIPFHSENRQQLSLAKAMIDENAEIQRLKKLLPPQLKNRVILQGTTEIKPPLIKCEKVSRQGQFQIQIDLICWEQMPIAQRNLLFWHEVARIQNKTIHKNNWEKAFIAIGLCAGLFEVGTQNILLLSLALTMSGLAGYQLYQRNCGECRLKEATQADQEAIALAIDFGYTLTKAYKSLRKALQFLMSQTSKKWLQGHYKARLQVLKVNANREEIE